MECAERYSGGRVNQLPFEGVHAGYYDVIVAGLGTAGAIAAVTAARQGLKVLAVERLHGMGGTGTIGAIWSYYYGSRGGLSESLDEKAVRLAAGCFTPSQGVNGEAKMIVMEQEAIRLGVVIRYESTITGVLMQGSRVCGIEWISAEGRLAAGSEVVIDCTGDAHVCAHAGAGVYYGRPLDGQTQPFSNVWLQLENGQVSSRHTDSGYVTQGDALTMSRANLQSATVSTHLKAVYEEQDRWLRLAPLTGVREGRLIKGEEQVTLERFLNDDYTAEPLFYAYAHVDMHSKDIAFESEILQKWTVACSMWGHTISVPVPLGALIPRGLEGLLAAGRCLAVDHDLATCIRMKRDMQKTGEAAAYAAYLSITGKVPLREVPYPELSALLAATGCLPISGQPAGAGPPWLDQPEAIREGMSSAHPGPAIWSAVRMGEPICAALRSWMAQDQDINLCKHSAFALALLGDTTSAAALRTIARDKDPFVPQSRLVHKRNHGRGYSAIFLLGLLADKEATDLLYALLEEPAEAFPEPDSSELSETCSEVHFQYISFAVTALARIGDRHSDTRKATAGAYRQLLQRKDLRLNVTLPGASHIPYDMFPKIRLCIEQTILRWGIEPLLSSR
ncbi:FAD-dependent oxidoreductase [Paenibacillus borealis]|uniref:FAD-dependent oxidoreductase n=1 Tax=Paenibacillus borealis TaxID=160799 RepID=UPI0006936C1D|nr:FAD-dependent oxidoreductase [Paenibacillus borealis]